MDTFFRCWAETRQVRSKSLTGEIAADYVDDLVGVHPVAVTDEIPATSTVCGVTIYGTSIVEERPFDEEPIPSRCSLCATKLGLDST